MIRHIVLIKVADRVSQDEIDAVFRLLGDLKNKISGIISFYSGANCSTEGLSRDYTHLFMMDFSDSAARDAYLPHPEHQAVQDPIFKILDDVEDNVLVMDFEF